MKNFILLFCSVFFCFIVKAQKNAAIPVDTLPLVKNGLSKDTVGIFNMVEYEAEFPGGFEAWKRYLYMNLNPDAPLKEIPKRVKHFQQQAVVQFIVCTDGTICDVKVVNNVLPSIKAEAERVIRNSGAWLPAMQNGRPVKAYRKQPIIFVVDAQ